MEIDGPGENTSMEKWIRQNGELTDIHDKPLNSRYYTREIADYQAHVFLVFLEHQKELKENWNWVDEYVAYHYQNEIESEIECSNFYICYFVKDKVDPDLQSNVEQGPYCAKKYVFAEKDLKEEDACCLLEEKLFSLQLEKKERQAKSRIKRITLKNFRKYSGERTFDLKDEQGKAASFVLLYAPNGKGKTSFTDGVEFALKGNVERLKTLSERSKAKGMIYRNIYHTDDEAYVKLVLEDEKGQKVVQRSIGKVKEGKNDVYRTRANQAGMDIVGGSIHADKWDLILLPHDSVDSFITANTPESRYKEWFDRAPDLKKERETFENVSKACKYLKKKAEEYQDGTKDWKGIRWYEKRIQELEEQAENVELFLMQAAGYNEHAAAGEELSVPEYGKGISLEEYQKILGEVKGLEIILKRKVEKEEKMQEQIRRLLNYGVERAARKQDEILRFRRTHKNLLESLEQSLKTSQEKVIEKTKHLKILNEQIEELEHSVKNAEETVQILNRQITVFDRDYTPGVDRFFLRFYDLQVYFMQLEEKREALTRIEREVNSLTESKRNQESLLEKIRSLAGAYVSSHSDLCQCPVCNTPFSSWNLLMEQVESVQPETQKLYRHRLSELEKQKEELTQEYQQIQKEMKKELRILLDSTLKQMQDKKEELEKLQTEQKNCAQELEKIQKHKQKQELSLKKEQNRGVAADPKTEAILEVYQRYQGLSHEEVQAIMNVSEKALTEYQICMDFLQNLHEDAGAKEYISEYQFCKAEKARLCHEVERNADKLNKKLKELEESKRNLQEALKAYFNQDTINRIYQKMDPHMVMKNISYRIEFEGETPQLFIQMNPEGMDSEKQSYQPELYFSTAQLNTVAFSSFFGRALEENDLPIRTIFVDDPIDNLDDMNMLGFADLMRCIIENTDCQVVMTTHDPKVLGIMARKLDKAHHSSCFISI